MVVTPFWKNRWWKTTPIYMCMIFHKKIFQCVMTPIPLFKTPQKIGLLKKSYSHDGSVVVVMVLVVVVVIVVLVVENLGSKHWQASQYAYCKGSHFLAFFISVIKCLVVKGKMWNDTWCFHLYFTCSKIGVGAFESSAIIQIIFLTFCTI